MRNMKTETITSNRTRTEPRQRRSGSEIENEPRLRIEQRWLSKLQQIQVKSHLRSIKEDGRINRKIKTDRCLATAWTTFQIWKTSSLRPEPIST